MANIAHPGTIGAEPIVRPDRPGNNWVPWALAALVVISGFGLGALYSSAVSTETAAPDLAPPPPLDEASPLPPIEAAVAPVFGVPSPTTPSGRALGPTEVSLFTQFPLMAFDWESVTIPTEAGFEFRWFGRLGDGYTVVGVEWPDDGFAQNLTTWTSPDGQTWARAGVLTIPGRMSLHQITGWGDRVFALGETWGEGDSGSRVLYSTTDGVDWTELPLPRVAESSDYVYIQGVASNDTGIVVALTVESYPTEPPQILEFPGYTIEIDHRAAVYRLIDAAGTVILTGSTADIWRSEDNGQGFYDPLTGELITVVPWQVWEQGWGSAYEGRESTSPLPVPIEPSQPYVAPSIVIEWDGFVVTLDENEGVFDVIEADSGEVVCSGPIDFIWRGPAPSFVDQSTGEVLFAVTWEEWDQAEMAFWDTRQEVYDSGWYPTRTVVLFSADGFEWEETLLSTSSAGASLTVTATDEEFVLFVNSYGEYGESSSLWTSVDGVDWEAAESSDQGERYLHNTVVTAGGLMGIGDWQGGQGVWSSADGLTWVTEFGVGPQDDGRHVWLNAVADGPLGSVVAGTQEGPFNYQLLRVSKDGMTAEFEGDFIVRITDDSTGDVVLFLTWNEFESGALGDRIVYADEETRFFDTDGNLILAITNEEARDAYRVRDGNSQPVVRQIMFIESDGEWYEVEVDGAAVGAIAGLVVGEEEVLLGGMDWGETRYWEEDYSVGASVVIMIGTPAG
ncbi:MAG: hypothetical protein P1T08_13135 [Acidimicrobiia bacterium]|nr:hypothetical protein [Acidimicrobiia bacterium]